MAILKDVILQQMAALIPDSQSNIRNGVYEFQDSLRTSAKALFKFLYESVIGNHVVPYFDPDKYELTDAFMLEVLEVDNYDRSMAGRYFIHKMVGGSVRQIGYLPGLPWSGDQVAILMHVGGDFYWKLVPHGNNLFSIVSRYNCPNDDLCDALLTWTEVFSTKYYVTIEHDDPALWEITRAKDGGYRIRCKWGCNRNPPHGMCNADLSYDKDSISRMNVVTITKDGGKTWGLKKARIGVVNVAAPPDRDVYQPITDKRRNPTSRTDSALQKKLLDLKKQGNLTESEYWRLRPSESTPAAFYGLPKIHKVKLEPKEDHFTLPKEATPQVPLRPINSCIGSPTYQLSKYLASILKSLQSESGFPVKNAK
ncbi:hypothetical protein ACROYT_G025671 [Oculina patagonica]